MNADENKNFFIGMIMFILACMSINFLATLTTQEFHPLNPVATACSLVISVLLIMWGIWLLTIKE